MVDETLPHEGLLSIGRANLQSCSHSKSRVARAAAAEAYMPLHYAPGDAYQFDWCHEVVLINGVTATVKVAHVRLCHSRMVLPAPTCATNWGLGPGDAQWQIVRYSLGARRRVGHARHLMQL
jgi:hypothetical protein